jgi:pantoate--beta-alanine ligase
MELVRRVTLMREISREARAKGRKISFVPTMGALHDGHLSLVRRGAELGDIVVVSIFVNPKQFGPAEDYDRYPRDLARDTDLCIQETVDYLFAPEVRDVYPPGFRTHVEVEGLSAVMEGDSRPGHFRGVATVVLKLLNIVRPHFAIFGQKDGQQGIILRRMVRDLNVDVELIIAPTARDDDGLALSSRNAYLAPDERAVAPELYRALEQGRSAVVEKGVRDARQVERAIRERLERQPKIRVDYIAIVDTEALAPRDTIEGETMLALAAWVGETRLIDNVIVEPPPREEAAAPEDTA